MAKLYHNIIENNLKDLYLLVCTVVLPACMKSI